MLEAEISSSNNHMNEGLIDMDFNYLRRELTKKFFNYLDDMVSDYRFAFKAIDNMEKSNLHKRSEDYEY